MQSLTRLDMVVIEDYYHMTTMNDNVSWMKLAHLLSIIPLTLVVPFVHLHEYPTKLLISFLNVHTREEPYISLMCIVYTNASNNTPFLHAR